MTISSTDDPRAGPFNGNGSQTAFPFEFKTFSKNDLLVVRTDDEGAEYVLVVDSDFSVALNADQNIDPGGTVTYPISGAELPVGETLTIVSDLEFTQTTDITNGGGFYPEVIENALDRNVMLIKQVNEKVDRALQVAVSTPDDIDVELPTPIALNIIGWNDDATQLRNFGPADGVTVIVQADDLAEDLADASDAAKADAMIAVKRTATGAVETDLHEWIEGTVLDAARDFGVVADGVTNQTAKMVTAIACATVLTPCTLELPRGVTYCATSIGNLAINGLTLKGKGLMESTLKFGHAGIAMLADAFASGSPSDPFVRANFLDFTIQGNAATTVIFQAQGLARCEMNLNAKEAEPTAGIAYHFKGVMLSDIRVRCSTDINAMTSVPYEGIRLEAGTRAAVNVGNSSNNTFISPRFVGLSIGQRFSGADQNIIVGGASESNSVYGLLIASGCRYNTFIGHGLENPSASSADLADAGQSTNFTNCYSAKKVLLQGRAASISGGFYERIEVQSGAADNSVDAVQLNNWRTGSGGFFDAGTNTKPTRLYGTTLTATFATSVMTVTAATQGVLAVGQVVVATGVTAGTTITSFGTGTGGTGTYNLSTSPGTLTSRAVSTLAKVEFLSDRTGITVGASPFEWKNSTGRYVEVAVQTGTVTQVRGMRGSDTWLRPVAIPGIHLVAPGDRLEVSYSVLPSMSYVPHNSFQG